MIGHQVTGEGRYYELRQGPIPSIHFEVTVEIGSATTSLVQVCNGNTFWSHRKLPTWDVLYKIDAVRATAALERARSKLPHEALASAPGLGGLGHLLRGLNSHFEFTTVVADQLGGLPVWKLNGGWRPDQLARLLPNEKEAIANGRKPDTAHLLAHLPDSVALYLGQEDCFPFRIDYLRSVPKSSPHLLLGLEFFELNFNGPIDSGQFLFAPAATCKSSTARRSLSTLWAMGASRARPVGQAASLQAMLSKPHQCRNPKKGSTKSETNQKSEVTTVRLSDD